MVLRRGSVVATVRRRPHRSSITVVHTLLVFAIGGIIIPSGYIAMSCVFFVPDQYLIQILPRMGTTRIPLSSRIRSIGVLIIVPPTRTVTARTTTTTV